MVLQQTLSVCLSVLHEFLVLVGIGSGRPKGGSELHMDGWMFYELIWAPPSPPSDDLSLSLSLSIQRQIEKMSVTLFLVKSSHFTAATRTPRRRHGQAKNIAG